MSKISFVYFDVGGVVIKDFSDSPKWDTMMSDMGMDKFDRTKVDAIYDQYEDEIAIGKRHVDTLLPIYAKEFGITFDPNFSMQAYFVDHFEQNRGIWPIIAKVKTSSRIGLLTDMYPGLLDLIRSKQLFPDTIWDLIIDSSLVGLRKPMPEIFALATEKACVNPDEILFIDNREKNLVPAAARGWQTFFYDSRDYEKSNRDLLQFMHAKFPI